MPKPAPAKKAASKVAPAKAAAEADAALDTKPEAVEETEATEEAEAATEEETPAREAPAMEAQGEPTDFDQILDLCRVIDKTFGSEMAKEGQQHFLMRMLSALNNSTTEQFDSLPVSAQTWYENSVEQANKEEQLTPPDGYIPAAKPAAKKAAAKKEAAPKTPKAPKEPKAPKAPKEKKPREASKTMPVRLAVCADPSISLEALMKQLPSIGKSTLSTTRSDTLATLEAARNAGWTPPSA